MSFEPGRAHRTRGFRILVPALMLGCLASVVPAHAHTAHITGTLQVVTGDRGGVGQQWGSIDLFQYENNNCATITDGTMAAVINVKAYRNHRATLRVTSRGPLDQVLPGIGATTCGSTDAYTEPLVRPGVASLRKASVFTIPTTATYLIIENAPGQMVGNTPGTVYLSATYQLDITDL